MNFAEGYLKHPHGILAFLMGAMVLGALSFRALPLNLFPDANYPAVSVIMVRPGASAEDMEDKVARRIEMALMGRHFCMPASMGIIWLAGITVNNSILLVNFIKRARQAGKSIETAIEAAISTRTRPILMTALSTMVGMLPIAAERAVGLERLSPLAVAAIGGLLVSTLLTLVYVPLLYTAIENTSTKKGFRGRINR